MEFYKEKNTMIMNIMKCTSQIFFFASKIIRNTVLKFTYRKDGKTKCFLY